MLRSLVGSEMCIRDRASAITDSILRLSSPKDVLQYGNGPTSHELPHGYTCLLYTSDAADDLLCVDLGGRRIIKKKKIVTITAYE